jgi:hypothetical protein
MATNPILAELSGLSPGAQQALVHAHTAMGGPGAAAAPTAAPTPKLQPPGAMSPTPAMGVSAHPPDLGAPPAADVHPPVERLDAPRLSAGPAPGLTAPSAPSMPQMSAPTSSSVSPPIRGTEQGDQLERSRLLSTGPGIGQIHSKIENSSFGQNHPTLGKVLGWGAEIPLRAAEVAGSMLGPTRTAETFIPGTQLHHALDVRNVNSVIGKESEEGVHSAQQHNLEAQPEIKEAQEELQHEKLDETQQHHEAQINEQLHSHGYKQDETGKIVPLSYAEMNPQQQAVTDLKGSQEELADARAALVKAQKDNIPSQIAMQEQRIRTAQQNASTAAGKLGLSQKEFLANYYGTDSGGQALPGAPADENGNPIGIRTAGVTKPPAVAQGRAAQGNAVMESAKDLKQFIDTNKDIFGNIDSYWKQAMNGTPISDPRASKAMAKIASFAALQPALHGMRGSQIMTEFTKMIGGVPKNPEAIKSAIDGVTESAATPMIHAGTVNHVAPKGGGGGSTGPKEGDTKVNSAGDKVKFSGGKWGPA